MFKSLIVARENLLLSRVVTDFRLVHLLPDDGSEMRVWLGWCGSLMMLTAFLGQCHIIPFNGGNVINQAVSTALCNSGIIPTFYPPLTSN